MVTRSPFSACVTSKVSAAGPSYTGATASRTQNSSPSIKRAAFTLPSRYFAARSGRAGVRRGSCIAFAQQFVDRARGLAFAAFGAPWLRGRGPAGNIDMQPTLGVGDEALQEQRADHRAGKAARRRVVDVGHLRVQPGIVRR